MAFSEFYLGSSSGPMNVSFGFNRPSYGVNYSLPYFARSHIPYMFIFKRIQNNRTGKLLSLREILQSNFCDKIQNNLLLKYNHREINNTPEDILEFSEDILREINGEKILKKEDKEIQKSFWEMYYRYSDNPDLNLQNLIINPSFLKKNIDLLN